MVDLTYSYEYAIIGLPNGEVVEGKVSSWTDFEDGDQIQVRIDGKTYLVHSSNVVLISD
jgi:ribosomal protein S1